MKLEATEIRREPDMDVYLDVEDYGDVQFDGRPILIWEANRTWYPWLTGKPARGIWVLFFEHGDDHLIPDVWESEVDDAIEAARRELASAARWQKVRENRLRRQAARRGLVVSKSRRRDPRANDYGRWFITDRDANVLLSPEQGLDFDEIEDWVTG